MALVNRSFSVNVTPGMMPPIVHVSEYDVGRAYTVSILDEQGNTFTIPSGTTASIEGTLNGSVGFTQSATVSNNQVSFTLSESMTAYSGKAWCKIKLTQNSQPIQTCAFILAVDRAGVEAGTVIGAPGFEKQIADAAEEWMEQQGFTSPTVSITPITGGNRVTFTDASHPQGQSIDVMNGESGLTETDTTLTASGEAADAKATGDAIKAVSDNVMTEMSVDLNSGMITSTGGTSAAGATTKEQYTNKLRVSSGSTIHYSLDYTATREMWFAYATYNLNGSFIARTVIFNGNTDSKSGQITIQDGVGFIAFTYRSYGEAVLSVSAPVSMIAQINSDDISGLTDEVYGSYEVLEFPLTGYYSGGVISNPSARKEISTRLIRLTPGAFIEISMSNATSVEMSAILALFDKDKKYITTLQVTKTGTDLQIKKFLGDVGAEYIGVSYRTFDTVDCEVRLYKSMTVNALISERKSAYWDAPFYEDDQSMSFLYGGLEWITGVIQTTNRALSSGSQNEMSTVNLIPVEPGKKYMLKNSNADWTSDWMRVAWFSGLGFTKEISNVTGNENTVFVAPINAKYCLICSRNMVGYTNTASWEVV